MSTVPLAPEYSRRELAFGRLAAAGLWTLAALVLATLAAWSFGPA